MHDLTWAYWFELRYNDSAPPSVGKQEESSGTRAPRHTGQDALDIAV